MINAKVKVIKEEGYSDYESTMNRFLGTIDVRQILRIESFPPANSIYRSVIYYVNFDIFLD